jgi:hypothetical protein
MSSFKLDIEYEEMKSFLLRRGYTIEMVNCWDSHNVYHNDVEYTDHKVEIAHKNSDLVKKLTNTNVQIVTQFSVRNVFSDVFKKTLLEL